MPLECKNDPAIFDVVVPHDIFAAQFDLRAQLVVVNYEKRRRINCSTCNVMFDVYAIFVLQDYGHFPSMCPPSPNATTKTSLVVAYNKHCYWWSYT